MDSSLTIENANIDEFSFNIDTDNIRGYFDMLFHDVINDELTNEQWDETVGKIIKESKPDDEFMFEWEVEYNKTTTSITFRFYQDDIESFEIYIFGHPDLIKDIEEKSTTYLEMLEEEL